METFKYFQQSINTLVGELMRSSSNTIVSLATPNPEQLVLANRDPEFTKTLHQFDYLLPDGIGIIWASKLLHAVDSNHPLLQERIAGVDVVEKLLAEAKKKSQKILIIGGRDYAGEILKLADGVRLEIGKDVQWVEGYRRAARPSQAEDRQLMAKISQLKPEIIFVAFGAPHQENWIIKHRQLLQSRGVRLAMAVGGSIDMLIGRTPRAPQSWQNLGLEWFWRLLQQPWRWRRQLALIEFTGLVIREAVSALTSREV